MMCLCCSAERHSHQRGDRAGFEQGPSMLLGISQLASERAIHLATEPLLQVQTALHDLLIVGTLLAAWQGELLRSLHSSGDALPVGRGCCKDQDMSAQRSPELLCPRLSEKRTNGLVGQHK